MLPRWFCCLILLILATISLCPANVISHHLFSDHMILQRDQPIPVFGMADPGERIVVRLADQVTTVCANEHGRWLARLRPMPAGGPYELILKGHYTEVLIKDVYLGEVWFCAGQSNMNMMLWQTGDKDEIATADDPLLRMFTVARIAVAAPQWNAEGQWEPTTHTTVRNFSAAAYYFGRHLRRDLKVPIGLINCSWGGAAARAFMSRQAIESDPILRASFPFHDIPQLRLFSRPILLYNGMIYPVIPYGIRGAIWYQGEADANAGAVYRRAFPTLIESWRRQWGQGNFPFLFVQLPGFDVDRANTWPALRDAQRETLALANTGMAVAIDIGEPDNIHPRNKKEVGRRLALWALGTTYGQKIVYSGPLYRSMTVEDGAIRLHFDHVGGGLTARDGQSLCAFSIAGEDRVFHPAQARIEGDTVVVASERIPKPFAVRYGWERNPNVNFFNKEGLPAAPFRTDAWPDGSERFLPKALPIKQRLATTLNGRVLLGKAGLPFGLARTTWRLVGAANLAETARLRSDRILLSHTRHGVGEARWVNETAKGFGRAAFARGCTAEIRLQMLVDGSTTQGVSLDVSMKDGETARDHYCLTITRTAVHHYEGSRCHVMQTGVDNFSAAHTYRLAIRSDEHLAQVYRDNELLGLAPATHSTSGNSHGPSSLSWGIQNGAGPVKALVEHVAWDLSGPLAPSARTTWD